MATPVPPPAEHVGLSSEDDYDDNGTVSLRYLAIDELS
jgi:hypothetical protein